MSQLAEFDTQLTADSVEWCPVPGLEEILACGTYQLNQHDNIRLGSLMLFEWEGNKLTVLPGTECYTSGAGVLDMKWKAEADRGLLATATSKGTVQFLQLQKAENKVSLSELAEADLKSQDDSAQAGKLHLSLSLDWGKQTNRIVVSDTLGQVGVVELCPSGPRLSQQWKAHSYEAWITCFGQDESTIYSGGDDCKLCVWDMRTGSSVPCFTSRWYDMGVCSLQIHPDAGHSHLLASGSYDERLALWDVRHMATPIKELSLGGGIWRVKWNPDSPSLAAAACMHNHFSVVDVHLGTGAPMEVVAEYRGHTSLAYGVDWYRKYKTENNSEMFTLASCSFYDHSLHLWSLCTKINEL